MKIVIAGEAEGGSVELRDPENFREFAVLVPGGTALDDPSSPIARVGRVADRDHLLVRRSALVELAGERGSDPAWLESLAGMIAYAESRGWVSADGGIRTHVERA